MPHPPSVAAESVPAAPLPRQIPYIIGNEACERFSFYGMRNILVEFLAASVLLAALPILDRQGYAKDIFHTFVIGVYFFPLLGGWLSDRYFGKYNTVLWFSLIYCAGHACLAMFEDSRSGFFTGLFLIALGSGGIKPLVVSFVGDQFDQTNKSRARVVFDAFYWIINFGSFFASLLMPLVLRNWGAAWAFGIPGILMFIATLIFWLGRKQYVNVPPSGPDPDSFLSVVKTALTRGAPGLGTIMAALAILVATLMLGLWATGASLWPSGWGFVITACLALGTLIGGVGWGASLQLERARGAHPDAAIDGVRAVLRILIVFALVTPFWSLFDQKASTWVLQGGEMVMPTFSSLPDGVAGFLRGWFASPSQMQALNPLFVMMLIPFNNLVLYPALRRFGFNPTPLRRMGWGIAFSAVAWVIAGAIQLQLDAGANLSIGWQTWPYLLLTFGEVLVSATALEFAYSQAPHAMKGVIMAFWYLTSTFGGLWVLLTNVTVRHPTVIGWITGQGWSENAFLMFFFAGFAAVAALAFIAYARRYPVQDNYRKA
ncbi:oligopeptide:H+ symporter [Arenimonas sp.]|uniref:POT-type proton-dependent oligopeptide transporter n=1 Tax=Arenimonas sp. TaxID=1872635 RepID=UPI002E370938|nr:oligopeptide:H+ symporter [Arenimonas sp.]HEX4854650.1 oligopeptide:H+ symporter [Arenimonas sp.]